MIDRLESEFRVLGSTAVEDNLQDEVQETLKYLIAAKIKVWMLTGDKEETAVNIGFSTGLLDNDVEKIRVTANSSAKVYK
jgi:phospholipid-transporting ATPase